MKMLIESSKLLTLSNSFPRRYLPPSQQYCRKHFSVEARIGNDILFGNIEALGNDFEQVNDTQKSLQGINANTAKAIENTGKKTAAEFSVNRQEKSIDRMKNHLFSSPIAQRIIYFAFLMSYY